ncbi:MAG: rRNA maturation RNase YbeY [Bacteroidales bacterium]
MVTYNIIDSDFKLKGRRKLSSWIKQVINLNKFEVGEINFIFSNDEYILEINKKYLNHNFYTDVITFDTSDYDEPLEIEKPNKNLISGDIFISVDTVLANSKTYGSTFEEEMNRVIIHGILHLIGFDDLNDEEKKEMREQENISLEILSKLD